MRHWCPNCGEETRAVRWCHDCWRMVIKTCVTQFTALAVVWFVHHMLSAVVNAIVVVMGDVVRVF